MGNKIKIFFNVISNSLNPDGYNQIVTIKTLGENTSSINSKREKNQNRINKVINGKIKETTN
ncbi:hypothetical protein [Aliarcobacter butzleri]|uniref:hypothetical protein n=1 Tax=Aliarcobacter butzleri TaxID=28197 RepID=UPI00125EBE52|nr:hypothetical protein [Aliarcobacter butzleri]